VAAVDDHVLLTSVPMYRRSCRGARHAPETSVDPFGPGARPRTGEIPRSCWSMPTRPALLEKKAGECGAVEDPHPADRGAPVRAPLPHEEGLTNRRLSSTAIRPPGGESTRTISLPATARAASGPRDASAGAKQPHHVEGAVVEREGSRRVHRGHVDRMVAAVIARTATLHHRHRVVQPDDEPSPASWPAKKLVKFPGPHGDVEYPAAGRQAGNAAAALSRSASIRHSRARLIAANP